MYLRISPKFKLKVRIYRVVEMILAMLMFSIFYIVQLPILAWIILAMLWKMMNPPKGDRNRSLHHNSKSLMASKL